MPAVNSYRWLGEYFDEVFAGFRVPIEQQREQLIGPLIAKVESACDLACGAGDTALSFARRGIRTFAVDGSASMVRVARAKVRAAGLPVRVLRGDMRDFRLPEPVDLVTCEYDAVNHVPKREDLSKVARAVCRALRPGGHFFFDVNNALGFKRYWTGNFWLESRNACVVMRNGHDEAAGRAWNDIEWFLRKGRLWERRRERVEEVCWTATEIRGALADAGFGRVRHWDGARFFGDHPLMSRGCRSVYLARKG